MSAAKATPTTTTSISNGNGEELVLLTTSADGVNVSATLPDGSNVDHLFPNPKDAYGFSMWLTIKIKGLRTAAAVARTNRRVEA